MKEIELLRQPLDSKLYFSLISSYLDLVISIGRSNFSRIEVTQYINENTSKDSIINVVDFEITLLVRDFYLKQATKLQRELIQNFFVKDHIESELAIDPLSVDTRVIALFPGQLTQQKEYLNNLFNELEQNSPKLSSDSFNTLVDNAKELIKRKEIEANIYSLQDNTQVNPWYLYALAIYQAHSEIVESYHNTRDDVQRLFSDFSQIRNKLRYSREDLLFITFSIFEKKLSLDELKAFELEQVQWHENVHLENQPNLKFDILSEQCPIFFSLLENDSVNESSSLVRYQIDQTEDKAKFTLKSSEIVRQLKQEIDFLDRSFNEDVEKLENVLSELIVLFDTIKNIVVPVTKEYNDMFFSLVEQVLVEDLNPVISSSGLSNKIAESSKLLIELRDINIYLEDIKNISVELRKKLIPVESTYHNQYDYYKYALEQEPTQISKLMIYLTLGWANTYKHVYYEEWLKALEPIEQHYYFLETKYKNKQAFWKYNQEHLLAVEDRKSSVLRRLDQLKDQIHTNLTNETKSLEFLQKKDRLINLISSSRIILDTQINDSLLPVEEFTSSIKRIQLVT